MAKNFNPAEVASVKTSFSVAPATNEASGLAFLVRRSKRRMRRENRAL